MRSNKIKYLIFLTILIITFSMIGCSSNETDTSSQEQEKQVPVRVGWTHHSENAILGNIVVNLLQEGLKVPVEISSSLGGTGLAHDAIIAGKIDIYCDYTGDALANVLKLEPITQPDKAFEACKNGYAEKYEITWLDPTPFNNTYALALKKDIADNLGISTISDLKQKAPEWVIGSSIEFSQRPKDGYPGMISCYGFEFKEIKALDPGLMYTAADKGDVDVIVAFATDARIGKFDLKVLSDDLNFFPSYNAAPTIRNETLEMYPEISDIFNEVFSGLDTETMINLNGKVDIENKSPEVVAKEYLIEKGFIN